MNAFNRIRKPLLRAIAPIHARIKPVLPAFFFLSGAVWDSLTLQRIDNPVDLGTQGAFLVASGILVVLIGRRVNFRFSRFFPNAAHFCYGCLLSAFRVYYFKSTASFSSFVFMLGLAGLLIGNELFEKRISSGQVSYMLFSICCVMYLNFALPVILHVMNAWVFLAGVAIALSASLAVRYLAAMPGMKFRPVPVLYGLLVVLYFTNVIPPVPLSTKVMGIYHSVRRDGQLYLCRMEQTSWRDFWRTDDRVYHYAAGDTIYCFASVFAPASFTTKVLHDWYVREPRSSDWREIGAIGYRLEGGREDGYHGYTFTRNAWPGEWKVVLRTEEGKTVGVIAFTVAGRDTAQPLELATVVR